MNILNIATYKFISLAAETLPILRDQLKQKAQQCGIKGTILLSTEGINVFLAGEIAAIELWMDDIKTIPEFFDLTFKRSESAYIPFKRLLVRIKREIITMQQPAIQPAQKTAPYLEPEQLRQWYQLQQEMVVLDTRNQYEVEMGTFSQASHLNIENFKDFPEAVANLPASFKTKPIVTFCTGGIRCEKAAAYLLEQGFTQVWQLKGGILNYFAQCGGEYFSGNCFVFDDRIALDAQLNPVHT